MNALNLKVMEKVPQTESVKANYSELDSFLNLLRLLIREPSVVGCEDSFFRVLSRELEKIGVKVDYYHGVFATETTAELAQRCDRLGISYSYKDAYIQAQNKLNNTSYSLGRTELGRLATASNGEINGTTLQIPSTNYHTADETASLASIEAIIKLLMSYVV